MRSSRESSRDSGRRGKSMAHVPRPAEGRVFFVGMSLVCGVVECV